VLFNLKKVFIKIIVWWLCMCVGFIYYVCIDVDVGMLVVVCVSFMVCGG